MKLKYVWAIAALCFSSFSAHACGFQAFGITKENAKAVKVALQSITPEVEFNSETGTIHFLSKEKVTQEQVDAALSRAGINNVKVSPVHHN